MTTFIKSHLISQSSSGIFHYNFEVISPLYLKLGLDSEKHINPKSLQYIMGHSDINITMNPYAHVSVDSVKSEVVKYFIYIFEVAHGSQEPDFTGIQVVSRPHAIVGPNGSGKSNISDAIRWVLGEQSSRSLRGAKMEDVIFGGTAKRGPVGFAEVSLILDNSAGIFRSPFAEIMVTRRYYRSGESEYSLGKKHCRLRDIRELFMDTGLGLDGYSSIGQGRIDEILSLRSEDRRGVFEEAAGITKFRARKEEAERRLAATEDNLTRPV